MSIYKSDNKIISDQGSPSWDIGDGDIGLFGEIAHDFFQKVIGDFGLLGILTKHDA